MPTSRSSRRRGALLGLHSQPAVMQLCCQFHRGGAHAYAREHGPETRSCQVAWLWAYKSMGAMLPLHLAPQRGWVGAAATCETKWRSYLVAVEYQPLPLLALWFVLVFPFQNPQEGRSVDDLDPLVLCQCQQVFVLADQVRGSGSLSCGQEFIVLGVA